MKNKEKKYNIPSPRVQNVESLKRCPPHLMTTYLPEPCSQTFLFKTQLNPIGLSVPHMKHITSLLGAQKVEAIYRFMTMVY
jgi:hypothetical protein